MIIYVNAINTLILSKIHIICGITLNCIFTNNSSAEMYKNYTYV